MNKQVILITGASSGIGKAAALQLIAEGHIVYGAARRVEKMQDLVQADGHALELDVTNSKHVEAGVNEILKRENRIDVLVNNAGFAVYGAIEDVSIEEAKRQFDVNIFGLAKITQEVLPVMRKQGSGKIINISSVGGKIYTPLGAWYHATKHALEGWSDCLRIEVKQFGINVSIIEPGAIKTEFDHVMMEPMMQRSGAGAYSKMALAMEKMSKSFYDKPSSSSPASLIGDVISKIVRSSKPKTRYIAGKMAKPMLFMRRWISDKMFDKIILSMLK